jgi:hypothetical protein
MIVEKLDAEIKAALARNERVMGFAMAPATLRYLESETTLWKGYYVPDGTARQSTYNLSGTAAFIEETPTDYYEIVVADLPIGEVFAATEPVVTYPPLDFEKWLPGGTKTFSTGGTWTGGWTVPLDTTTTGVYGSFMDDLTKGVWEQTGTTPSISFTAPGREKNWLDRLNVKNRNKRR